MPTQYLSDDLIIIFVVSFLILKNSLSCCLQTTKLCSPFDKYVVNDACGPANGAIFSKNALK